MTTSIDTENALEALTEESNMLAPQTVNPYDSILTFQGKDVITERGKGAQPNDSYYGDYQKEISKLDGNPTQLTVSVHIMDMSVREANGDPVKSTTNDVIMKYDSDTDFWYIKLDTSTTTTGTLNLLPFIYHKVVGKITSSDYQMRDINILEFSVDDEMLTKTLATKGYEIEIGTSDSYFLWKDDSGNILYKARAYTGGTGKANQSSVAEVTHRGPVEKAY